jgi:hypothetical protein
MAGPLGPLVSAGAAIGKEVVSELTLDGKVDVAKVLKQGSVTLLSETLGGVIKRTFPLPPQSNPFARALSSCFYDYAIELVRTPAAEGAVAAAMAGFEGKSAEEMLGAAIDGAMKRAKSLLTFKAFITRMGKTGAADFVRDRFKAEVASRAGRVFEASEQIDRAFASLWDALLAGSSAPTRDRP